MSDFGAGHDRAQRIEIEFLRIDLDIGLTRARIAAQEKPGSEKRRRNATEANKAYQTVLHFRARAVLAPDQAASIDAKLTELRMALEQLGLCTPELTSTDE